MKTNHHARPDHDRRRTASSMKGARVKMLPICMTAALAFGMVGCTGMADDGSEAVSQNADAAADAASEEYDFDFTDRDKDPSYDDAAATHINLKGASAAAEGEGAQVDGSTVSITKEGTYVVSGELDDGQIVVDTSSEEKVQVVLAGASIHNEDGPAFYVSNADKVFVTLADGTQNELSDGSSHATDEEGDDLGAALYSKDDLTINGSGSLTVEGNFYHAIKSNDDLVITGGTFTVTSEQDAFHGKDCVKVADGTFTVDAGDDAFHSDLLTYFAGGEVDVIGCYEGYEGQAVVVDGGTHTVVAEDDALNAALADSSTTEGQQTQQFAGGGQFVQDEAGASSDMAQASDRANPPEGGESFGQMPGGEQSGNDQMPNGDRGGQHDGSERPEIPGDGGSMQQPDGVPPQQSDGVTGDVAPGGMGKGDMNGGFGGDMATTSEDCLIQINGGELHLTGGNDAIDSNGNVEINGGTIVACGPSNGMDGALDYDLDASINGGTVLMVGSIGSTRGLDASTQEYRIEQQSGSAGATVQLLAGNGDVLVEVQAPLAFQQVLASASQSDFKISVAD